MTDTDRTTRDFTLTWTLDASPTDAFRAWTDPGHLGWYYNDEQPIPDEPIELDLRVGGAWRQMMVIDEDTRYHTGGVYREIVPGRRLVFAWGATDGWPQVTVTFSETGDGTELVLHVALPASMPDDGVPGWWSFVENGWRDTVDRLAASLTSTRTAI